VSLRGALLRRTRNEAPVPYAARGISMSPFGPLIGVADKTTQMSAYGSVGTLFAIVSALSEDVAAVDWKLWRKDPSGREEDRNEVTTHAALSVLREPNPYMTTGEFFESFQQHLDLTGEAWWVYTRGSGLVIPTEVWPVRPDRMSPVPGSTTFLERYEYRSPDGRIIPLDKDEVTFLRRPNPLDPYRGMGPVQTILSDLDSSRYSAEWNRQFFLNDATPGGVIELPNTLQDEELDELIEHWDRQHKGIGNAHRVAFIEMGKWVDRKFSQRDMQFTELRDMSRDVIREAFRFPKAMLGISDDVNRATAEAQEYAYGKRLIVPRLERIKGALNSDFLPLFYPNVPKPQIPVEFDYCNPVPEDVESESKVMETKVRATVTLVRGGFDPAEACAFTGLPPMLWDSARMTGNTPEGAPA
jgi:HK97 family phage portal protein